MKLFLTLTQVCSLITYAVVRRRRERTVVEPTAPHPATLIPIVSPGRCPPQLHPAYPPPQYMRLQQQQQQQQHLTVPSAPSEPSSAVVGASTAPPPYHPSAPVVLGAGDQPRDGDGGDGQQSVEHMSPPPTYREATHGR